MISNVKFNELAGRVDLLVGKVEELEGQLKALTDSQGGEIPPGMSPVTTLAAEFGISTKKAEELAHNSGVMLIKHKGTDSFRSDGLSLIGIAHEYAAAVTESADREIGLTK